MLEQGLKEAKRLSVHVSADSNEERLPSRCQNLDEMRVNRGFLPCFVVALCCRRPCLVGMRHPSVALLVFHNFRFESSSRTCLA